MHRNRALADKQRACDLAVTVALGEQGLVLEHGRIVESGNIRQLHDEGVLEERLAL